MIHFQPIIDLKPTEQACSGPHSCPLLTLFDCVIAVAIRVVRHVSEQRVVGMRVLGAQAVCVCSRVCAAPACEFAWNVLIKTGNGQKHTDPNAQTQENNDMQPSLNNTTWTQHMWLKINLQGLTARSKRVDEIPHIFMMCRLMEILFKKKERRSRPEAAARPSRYTPEW